MEKAAQKQSLEAMESALAELMRSSEEVLQHVEELRHEERELNQQLTALEALSAAEQQEGLALEGKLMEPKAAPKAGPLNKVAVGGVDAADAHDVQVDVANV